MGTKLKLSLPNTEVPFMEISGNTLSPDLRSSSEISPMPNSLNDILAAWLSHAALLSSIFTCSGVLGLSVTCAGESYINIACMAFIAVLMYTPTKDIRNTERVMLARVSTVRFLSRSSHLRIIMNS